VPDTFAVRGGERIRLRLVNAANARVFGLRFAGHQPMVIA
jgi:FtsP/CotA-like multicopper oxidase with cupredoxin domain